MTAHRLPWFHISGLLSVAVALASAGALAGCHINVVDGGTPCDVDGTVYSPGDSFLDKDGCNTCVCSDDGTIACTRKACVPGCTYDGVNHAPGDSFRASDGCNACICDPSGSGNVECSTIACEGCAPGEELPMDDGCNTCRCDADGIAVCTAVLCYDGCFYEGSIYEVGEAFPSIDGCNTCTCAADGSVACTERACACDPEAEWWRSYAGDSPETCQLIDFVCPDTTAYFQNACGCGCEQDASCPPSFNCMPPEPCDVEAIQERCPYSEIVF
ncbi:hypothetical protein [Sorangium sp. So ce385]|uniref:hypothetical protein n=1 Tax=Sorangium sp. So ce385 TaxID=3133308 RepID=UPI003F5C8324